MNDVSPPSERRSLASELQVVRQAFPNALIDGEGWRRLLARATTVPASMIENVFGFELRLGQSERAADFCITIQAESEKASEFFQFPQNEKYDGQTEPNEHPQQNLISNPTASPANESLINLLSEIALKGSFANDFVPIPGIILEYDVVEIEGEKRRAPGVFWGLAEHIGPEHMVGVVRMLDIAQGQPVSPSHNDGQTPHRVTNDARVNTLHRIAEAATPYGRISQVGSFLGRESPYFRILVRIADRGSVGEFLHTVGWPGNVAKAIEVVSTFDFEDVGVGVALDVAHDEVGPRAGLEVSAEGGWFQTRIADWQPLIDVLVDKGWCREDKAKGLQQWCGYLTLFGPKMYMLVKGINHFKISIRDDENPEAKAYIGACRVLAEDVGFG